MEEPGLDHRVARAVLFVGGEQPVRLGFEIPTLGIPTGIPSARLQDGEKLMTGGIRGAEEADFGGELV